MAAPVAARSISSISVYSRRSPLLAGPLVPTLDVLRGLHKGRCRLHLQRVVVAEAKNTEFTRVGSSKSKSTATVVASPETVANQGYVPLCHNANELSECSVGVSCILMFLFIFIFNLLMGSSELLSRC